MRFVVLVKATKDSEAGILPTTEEFAAMGAFNETLVKDGVMLAGEGLKASSAGARLLRRRPHDRHRRIRSPRPKNSSPLLDRPVQIEGRSDRTIQPRARSAGERSRSVRFEAAEISANLTPELREQEARQQGCKR